MSPAGLNQLPILQVVVPMMTAPLCLLARRSRVAWVLALAATWAAFVDSLRLLDRVLGTGLISYALGGWQVPWGIEVQIDAVSAFVLVIVSGISAVVLAAAPRSLDADLPRHRHYLFYAAFLLCVTGLLGMTSAGDAFNIFVFLEISSLAAYSLVAMGPRRRALTSAFRYLIIGAIGGSLFLLGIAMLYMKTGTLNIDDMAAHLGAPNRTVLVALTCVVVGVGIKLALMPLGAWLPNAYTYAPAIVSAFLAATATKVAYYVLARFIFHIFGAELAFETLHLRAMLLPLAVLAMVAASTVAIFQQDVKRLLAYSSLAQIGYMVLGLSLASLTGLTGGIVHLFNHALMKSGLFLALACVALRLGSTRLSDMRGLGRRMPVTMAAFVMGGLSLIGVPLTVGFVSKWYLVLAALEKGWWWLAVLILGSSLLAIIYIWRVVEAAYFMDPPQGSKPLREAPLSLLVPTWLMIGATLFFGIVTDPAVGAARKAAQILLGGSP